MFDDLHDVSSYVPALGLDLTGFEPLTIPYAGQTRMRLAIASGLADARIRVDPAAKHLIAIDGAEDNPPRLRLSGSEIGLSWRKAFGAWLCDLLVGESRDVELVLHPAVEWTLLVRGGLSRVEADFTSGKLARIEISGGVSNVQLDLPSPQTVVPVRLSGGASELGLRRPDDTGVSLAVRGGISQLLLDEQRFSAIGGGAQLATRIAGPDAPRYAIEISGGASGLLIVSESARP